MAHYVAVIVSDAILGVLIFGLWVCCLIDVITTDPSQIRTLPKTAWVLIVLFLVTIGAVLWLVAGRP